jgi:hypothetical protein
MSRSKYHRKQAKILAGLALSTNDVTKADQFKLAAMEHLERAQISPDSDVEPSRRTGPDADQDGNRA